MSEACATELKATQSHTLVSAESKFSIESVSAPTRFSTLTKLIEVIAMVLRAAQRFKSAERADQPSGHIMDERKQAEALWMKCAQRNLSYMKILAQSLLTSKACGVVVAD